MAPNPLKQAFLKRKKSIFGGPSNFDFLVLGFFLNILSLEIFFNIYVVIFVNIYSALDFF